MACNAASMLAAEVLRLVHRIENRSAESRERRHDQQQVQHFSRVHIVTHSPRQFPRRLAQDAAKAERPARRRSNPSEPDRTPPIPNPGPEAQEPRKAASPSFHPSSERLSPSSGGNLRSHTMRGFDSGQVRRRSSTPPSG